MVPLEESNPLPDLDRCAQEPVQIIGHIQSHGVLFAISEPDLIVRQVSENVAVLLGMPTGLVLGRSIEAVLGARQFETFRSEALSATLPSSDPLRLRVGLNATAMDCITHRSNGMLIVELELREGAFSIEPLNLHAHIQTPLSRLEAASGILELSEVAASEIRGLSGFDRVMVYVFDEAWNGEVIAEAATPSSTSYLGLHFPASDIPAQVRRLFLLNPLRAIADVAAAAVPIVPEIGPLTGTALDLTRSFLRSAAPIHLEYLRNMGVASSLTISIVVGRRLWGMIACHHATPRHVDCSTRSVCLVIGQILASQVALRVDNAALEAQLASRKRLEKYMADVDASSSVTGMEQFQGPALLSLLDADGLVSRIDGVVSSWGSTVEEQLLLPVIDKLRTLCSRGIASSNLLNALDPSAASYASQASGALYIGLSEGPGDYVLLLRRELLETVVWAGNPDKAVSVEQERLRPRASFAAWRETVRGRSRPWRELELENAGVLREQLLRLRGVEKLHKSEEQVRYLALHDALTGLLNRHSIQLKLQKCVQDGAAARHSSFAVLFVDLDHFKHFNDTLGHAAGDRILQAVAKRMQRQVRAEDSVGRLGGDEFIVILIDLGSDTDTAVFRTASRILRAVAEPLGLGTGAPIDITASIGLSRYPSDGTTADMLLSRSDMAMYRVKRGGGNGLELCREEDFLADDRTA